MASDQILLSHKHRVSLSYLIQWCTLSRQAYRQIDGQMDRQTNRHICVECRNRVKFIVMDTIMFV